MTQQPRPRTAEGSVHTRTARAQRRCPACAAL